MSQAGDVAENAESVEQDDAQTAEGHFGRIVLASIMFAIPVVAVAMAPNFTEDARKAPLVVGIPFVALTGTNLVREVAVWRRSRTYREVGTANVGSARSAWLE